MKKALLVLGFAALGLITQQTAATELVQAGTVTVGMANRDVKATDEGSGNDSFQKRVSGMYSLPLSSLWKSITVPVSIQLDYLKEYSDGLNDDEDVAEMSQTTVHASYRNPDRWMAGMLMGYGRSNLTKADTYEMEFWGIEGQYYYNDFTFYGQTIRGDMTASDGEQEGFVNGINSLLAARYFVNDDLKIQVTVEDGRTPRYIDGLDEGDFNSAGISVETRVLKSMPLYAKLDYTRAHYKAMKNEDDELDEGIIGLSVSYLFGAQSLKQNDRSGATLEAPMLPVRANGYAEMMD